MTRITKSVNPFRPLKHFPSCSSLNTSPLFPSCEQTYPLPLLPTPGSITKQTPSALIISTHTHSLVHHLTPQHTTRLCAVSGKNSAAHHMQMFNYQYHDGDENPPQACISSYLRVNATCPICRKPLNEITCTPRFHCFVFVFFLLP